jgi:hypothetical protein
VELAAYPDATYLILSLADQRAPVLRGFRIRDGQVDEVPLQVGGSGGLKSEARTQEAGGQLEPSGSPPVNKGSGGLKSEAPTHAAGGHPQPSGSPPVDQGAVGR